MDNIDIWNKAIDLLEVFDGISDERLFLNVFEDIKQWYWENFSDKEKREIKNKRNEWCAEFPDKSDDFKKAVIGNRIDKYLFEYRNNDYVEIDIEAIRPMKNTNRQRKFREIALELKKRLNAREFSKEWIKIIKSEFLKAKNSDTIPDIDKIMWLLNDVNYSIDVKDADEYWIPDNEIFDIEQNLSSEDSQIFENIIINGIILHEKLDKLRKRQIQKKFSVLRKIFKDIDDDDFETNLIFIEASYESVHDWEMLIEKTCDKLNSSDPNILKKLWKTIDVRDINDSDLSRNEEEFLTEEDKKDIEYLVKEWWYSKDYAMKLKIKYNKLLKKIEDNENLTKEEEVDYAKLCVLFWKWWKWWYVRKLRRLKEIENLQVARASEFAPRHRNSSIEYATWNIKDIKPMAIIENNDQVKNYVYWSKEVRENLDVNDLYLSTDDKIRLFNKLKEQKKWDLAFLDSKKYLNDDLSINEDLVNLSWVSMESVIERQKEIEYMVKELAVQENIEKLDKKKIEEINIRRSCMFCCFRAISRFFDTVNNNGENFASEFEIKDPNENIQFDGKIITMEWTIWANKNHIKLYYDTEHWKLFFDNFLNYDPINGYQIWKWNWAKKEIDISLPTMENMEKAASSINFNLIDSLSLNMRQYNRMVWFAMSESIRLNCFIWFMWDNLESNKVLIQKFNEENILKQDIIYTIYSKFYNQDELIKKFDKCLPINKDTEPAQFKLIELISKSIDCYWWDANQLLRFRNYINKLDTILTTNHDVIEKDYLLRYLFVDKQNIKDDVVDCSKKILKQENEDWIASKHDEIVTYENYDDMVRYQKYVKQENKQLNYYIFLNLLSRNEWADRIIDLNEFENVLDTIEKIMGTSAKLLDKKKWLLRENYQMMMSIWEIPDIISMWKEISEVSNKSAGESADLQLDVNMHTI